MLKRIEKALTAEKFMLIVTFWFALQAFRYRAELDVGLVTAYLAKWTVGMVMVLGVSSMCQSTFGWPKNH